MVNLLRCFQIFPASAAYALGCCEVHHGVDSLLANVACYFRTLRAFLAYIIEGLLEIPYMLKG